MPGRAAADDVDPLDLAGLDAAQGVLEALALGRRALTVDQHVAGRAAVAADIVAAIEGEARNAGDHVHCRVGLRRGEEGRHIGRHGVAVGGLHGAGLRRRRGQQSEKQRITHGKASPLAPRPDWRGP